MKLTLVKSEKGSALEELHIQIMQFKNWLRGIHHKCSKEHLHAYLNEYVLGLTGEINESIYLMR